MTENSLLQEARNRVDIKKKFYMHFGTFCIVTLFLFGINLLTTPGFWWFLLPTAGWSMAVLGHFFSIFKYFNLPGKNWEKKQLEKELKALNQHQKFDDINETRLSLEERRLDLNQRPVTRKKYNDEDLV